MDERIYQIALSLLSGLGPVRAKKLVATVGNLEGVFTESKKALSSLDGISSHMVDQMDRERALIKAEQELTFIEKHNIQLYYYKDASYPVMLKNIEDSPIVMFTKGNINLKRRAVSVVGTRKATPYGKKMCRQLIEELSGMDLQIVSGLAHGIDKCAHEAALDNKLETMAVLGHGLDIIYPAAHRTLARRMLEHGGLITEFVSETPGDPTNFPRRNRIVAGLCDALVVVESSEKGGSMITANLANDYNREVFAFPGNADQESTKGCNNLIRRNRAHLISNAEDMMNVLGWQLSTNEKTIQSSLFIEMNEEEEKLVDILREKGELDIDTLSLATSMSTSSLSLHLFNLEMKGKLRVLPGKNYKLI